MNTKSLNQSAGPLYAVLKPSSKARALPLSLALIAFYLLYFTTGFYCL
jgi:hypothetical protein